MKPTAKCTQLGAVALLVLASSAPAHAQGTGRSMDIDPSVRSTGMGGASNAVFWGGELNYWGNPALLGYQRGVQYEWTRTQLVPDLADDVYLTSRVVKFGAGGIGFVISGTPGGLGGVKLDYGQSEVTDQQGNFTGTFDAYETVDSFGFGVSVAEMIDSFRGLGGAGPSGLGRRADVSFGMNFKDVEIALAPALFLGRSSASTRDIGALVRVTPIDFADEGGRSPLRVDLAYGWSVLNYNDALFTFINEDVASPATRHRRNGVAMRAAFDPEGWGSQPATGNPSAWFLRGLSPLISLGVGADWNRISAGGSSSHYNTTGIGAELTLANVLSGRMGRYEDKLGDIGDITWGWMLAAPIGHLGGLRYEEAHFPEATGLDYVRHRGFSAWIDPLAIWSALHAPAGAMAAGYRIP